MASYDKQQQVFCLSMLSNTPSSITGPECDIAQQSTEEVINTLNKEGVIELIGEWEVVWGMGVFQVSAEKKDLADNAMYVAKSKTGPIRYIIGIAGTNPSSWYAWLIEDFFVSKMIQWPYASPNGLSPRISAGTATGLEHLQDMLPCAGLPGEGQTLQQFLTQAIAAEPNEPIEVISSGHSLGGALSPTLALWLQDIKDEWDPHHKTTVITYPSAGATAGDRDFASYSDSALSGRCHRIWNKLDIVPHAWNVDQLREIPTLYEPQIPSSPYVELFVALAIFNTNGHPYMQIEVDTPPLPGEVIAEPGGDSFTEFMNEAFYQHFVNYFNLLGVQEFWSYISGDLGEMGTRALVNPAVVKLSDEEIEELKTKLDAFKQSQN